MWFESSVESECGLHLSSANELRIGGPQNLGDVGKSGDRFDIACKF